MKKRYYSMIIKGQLAPVGTPFGPPAIFDPTLLFAPLKTNLLYNGNKKATFPRGSARVFEDWEGNYVRTTNVNEATFKARRLHNLLAADSSEDFSVASWAKGGTATVTGTNVLNFPSSSDNVTQTLSASGLYTNKTFVFSVSLSGSGTVTIMILHGGGVAVATKKIVTLQSTAQRFSMLHTFDGAGAYVRIYRADIGQSTQVTATNAMLEEVTAQSNVNPSEYTSTHQYYGGQPVKGVQYLGYENGNTVDANGVVTEAQGAAIPAATLTGYQYDGAATNKIAGAYNAVGPDMLGAELNTNVPFTANITGWAGTDWAWQTDGAGGGWARKTAAATNALAMAQSLGYGKKYSVTYTIGGVTAGSIARINWGAGGGGTTVNQGDGTYTQTGVIFGPTNSVISFTPTADFDGYLDNISIKEIGAANLAGTFWSGGGTDALASYIGSWQNPLPGITMAGGTGSTTTITDVSAVITATNKYKRLTPATKWYVTTASGGDATVDFTGALSAAAHTLSLVAYGATASDVLTLGTNTVAGTPQTVTTAPLLYTQTLTANAADTMRLTVADGDTITWCLMQAETGTVPTSRIIVEGAAASRSRDALTIPVADGTNFRQREGTASVDVTWGFGSASIPNGVSCPILAINGGSGFMYLNVAGGVMRLISYDGTGGITKNLTAFVLNESASLKSTWSAVKGKLSLFNFVDGWSTGTYDGTFVLSGGNLAVGATASLLPFALKNLRVLGTADPGGM